MKKLGSLSLALAGVFVLNTQAASLDDIQLWTGSGANRAALVIDWNDGKTPESLLWGYRWDGSATGLDMFQAVVNADPRLFAHLGTFSWGTSVLGIGYDLNGNSSFGVTPSLSFDAGGLFVEAGSDDADDARLAWENGDRYAEGWNNGFWGYSLKAYAGDAWTDALSGAGERALTDGAWDGYSFAPGFASSAPSEPLAAMAVPEPGTLALLGLGFLALCIRRIRL